MRKLGMIQEVLIYNHQEEQENDKAEEPAISSLLCIWITGLCITDIF